MASSTKELLQSKQQYLLLGALAILGVVLLLFGSGDKDTAQTSLTQPAAVNTSAQQTDYISALEQKLARTLSQIQNAGNVTVQISAKNTGRKEYAVDTQRTGRTSNEENGDTRQTSIEEQEQITIVQQNHNGVQQALVVEETMPEIIGVLVVASGACDAAVQERLIHAVSAVLQIPLYQIMVVPGEEQK